MVRWCWVNFQPTKRPTNLVQSRARAYCACSIWGWGAFFLSSIISLVYHFSFLSPSFWEGVVGWCDGAGQTSSAGASY